MPSEVQVVYWRDIPAQVKARQGRERASGALSQRFQEAIDVAAMRVGLTDTDAYLEQWKASAWEASELSPEAAVAARVGELEAAYDEASLSRLAESGGLER